MGASAPNGHFRRGKESAVQVVVGVKSDPGKVRAHNEDNYIVGQQLWAVADGMGGQAAGAVASGIVTKHLRDRDGGGPLAESDVAPLLDGINQAIVAYGNLNTESAGLGSTVSGLASVRLGGADHWAVFNIGDSRVYRYANGQLQRETTDHSEVQELVEAGRLNPALADTHPARNILTRSLGSVPSPRADVLVRPQEAGDVFLICSDGLTTEVSESAIAAVLRDYSDPTQVADRLVDLALAHGGRDNVTVVVLIVGPDGPAATNLNDDTIPKTSLIEGHE
jgi:protein phosphatase